MLIGKCFFTVTTPYCSLTIFIAKHKRCNVLGKTSFDIALVFTEKSQLKKQNAYGKS